MSRAPRLLIAAARRSVRSHTNATYQIVDGRMSGVYDSISAPAEQGLFRRRVPMNKKRGALLQRRDLLRAMTTGVALAAVAPLNDEAEAAPGPAEKRKARYQANSPEVQDFYRVNRYPPQ